MTIFLDRVHVERCVACDEGINPEDEIFVTPDDRVFHPECWEAWLLDNQEN